MEVLGSVHNGAAVAARTQAWVGVCSSQSNGERRGGPAACLCVLPKCRRSEMAVYRIGAWAAYEPRAARDWWGARRCIPAQPWPSNTPSARLLHNWPILSRNRLRRLCPVCMALTRAPKRCGLMIRSTRNSPATQCTRPDKTLVLHRQGVVQHNTARRLQGQRIPV